jgi:hypothetical protein
MGYIVIRTQGGTALGSEHPSRYLPIPHKAVQLMPIKQGTLTEASLPGTTKESYDDRGLDCDVGP